MANLSECASACVFLISLVCGLSLGQELRFLVLGDWGGLPVFPYRTDVEQAVAAQMGMIADRYRTQFVLGLGDNFYFDGVQNISDPRFKDTFENVFTARSLQSKWYMTAGNHDHNGNITAQIEYSKVSSRWTYPSLYYSVNFTIPSTKTTLSLVMIDTVNLCGNTDHDFSGEPPIGPSNVKAAQAQWDWIESQLKNNTADYIIVAGHYPVLSIAEHGPTKCLVDTLMPKLYKYNVTAYFSGHDHNLQHLVSSRQDQTMNYFVVGCANFIDPSQKHKESVPKDDSKFFWADQEKLGGFGLVSISKQNMTFTFMDSHAGKTGKNLYKPIILKPRK